MSEQKHHHHHHRHRDEASLFKERSLRSIRLRRLLDKWMKIGMLVVAVIMCILLVLAYTIG